MVCFTAKIFKGECDEQVHRQFVRFSRGTFAGRAALSLVKKDRIKLGGSFEYATDFVNFVAENAQDAKFSGAILSREKIEEFGKAKEKNGIFGYEVTEITSAKIMEIKDKAYSMLLDAQAGGLDLKMKKKLPKPGKSGELKIDDKFVIIECDMKFWQNMKDFFMLPDCGKCKIFHTFIINEVIIDKNEKDFAKMRETAKKKGKIVRKMSVDKNETQTEKDFEA
jgi:hypothetical protein